MTSIFIILKLTGVISWGWFYVFLPLIIEVGLYTVVYVVMFIQTIKFNKEVKKFRSRAKK